MREMKDGRIEWIENIPSDWTVVPLKWIVKFGKGLPITKDNLVEQGVPVVSYGQIHSKINSGTHLGKDLIRFVSEKYFQSNPSSLGKKGDIFFADTSEDYAGVGNAILVDGDEPVFAGYHTIIVRPIDLLYSKYLAYLFLTDAWRSQLCSRVSGIKVFSVTQGLLKETTVILPPTEKIATMTDYLDRKCSQIDAIIARQQEVIEKLKSYQLSKINEIVVEVEGITAHLGYVSNMKNGLNFNVVPDGKTLKFLGVGDFKDHYMLDSEEMFSDLLIDDEVDNDYMLQSGDIIFVRSNGSKELVGRAVMVENVTFPLLYSGFCIRLRNLRKDIINSKYLLYFFRSPYFRKQLEKYSQGSNITNISQVLLSQISIIIPPVEVQLEAIRKVEKLLGAIDKLIKGKQEIISSLERYKKSLIYEVVTGKKEV